MRWAWKLTEEKYTDGESLSTSWHSMLSKCCALPGGIGSGAAMEPVQRRPTSCGHADTAVA